MRVEFFAAIIAAIQLSANAVSLKVDTDQPMGGMGGRPGGPGGDPFDGPPRMGGGPPGMGGSPGMGAQNGQHDGGDYIDVHYHSNSPAPMLGGGV